MVFNLYVSIYFESPSRLTKCCIEVSLFVCPSIELHTVKLPGTPFITTGTIYLDFDETF